MPALPTVRSTHPGVPKRVIRQEKEAKGVRIGKEEADLGLATGDARPGLVTPLAASSLSVGLIVSRQSLLTQGPRPSLLCALCSGRVSSVAVDVPAAPTPPSEARRHAPGPQTQLFTCPRRGGGGARRRAEADRDWTRSLPAGPRPPAVAASVSAACGFCLNVPRACPVTQRFPPGASSLLERALLAASSTPRARGPLASFSARMPGVSTHTWSLLASLSTRPALASPGPRSPGGGFLSALVLDRQAAAEGTGQKQPGAWSPTCPQACHCLGRSPGPPGTATSPV